MLSEQVGIFWFVGAAGAHFVHQSVPVGEADDYGECKTFSGGHYEFWEKLRISNVNFRKAHDFPAWATHYDYEDFPRGRVVYDSLRNSFIIYIDRKLNHKKHLNMIRRKFGLRHAGSEVMFDDHYLSYESIL